MKKVILIFILSASIATANAQFSVGPKIGLDLSSAKFSNPDVQPDPLIISFDAAAFLNYKFAKQFAGQMEILYSNEGAKYKMKGDPAIYSADLKYLDIPLLVQFITHGGFYVETGPQIGFLLVAKQTDNGITRDIKNLVQPTKFSWCFGLGTHIAKRIGIELRYAAGLSNINKGSTIKDNVISLNLSYAIKIK